MTNTATTTYVPHWSANKLEAWIKRADRWFALCDALTAARGTDAEPDAFRAWEKGRMPSKNSKHQAYSDGHSLARFLGLAAPQTRDDLAQILAAFRAQEGKQKS